jgi:hypothetical protein
VAPVLRRQPGRRGTLRADLAQRAAAAPACDRDPLARCDQVKRWRRQRDPRTRGPNRRAPSGAAAPAAGAQVGSRRSARLWNLGCELPRDLPPRRGGGARRSARRCDGARLDGRGAARPRRRLQLARAVARRARAGRRPRARSSVRLRPPRLGAARGPRLRSALRPRTGGGRGRVGAQLVGSAGPNRAGVSSRARRSPVRPWRRSRFRTEAAGRTRFPAGSPARCPRPRAWRPAAGPCRCPRTRRRR